MSTENRKIIKKIRAGSSENMDDDGFINADPSYLFGIMWELTRDAWAFKGDNNAEQRLQRHITNFSRRKS